MTTFMTVVMAGDYVEAVKNVDHVLEVVGGSQRRRWLPSAHHWRSASIAFEQNETVREGLAAGRADRHSSCAGDSGGPLRHFGGGADADRTVHRRHHSRPGHNGR